MDLVSSRVRQHDLLRALVLAQAGGRVDSVAVVGNKPLDPDASRAAAIDACDVVVRVNSFRLDDPSDEPTSGRRADVIVFNRGVRATPWFFEGYQDRVYLLVEPGRLQSERAAVPPWWPADLGQVHLSNSELTLPLSGALGLDSRRDGLWATTGTMAAWWACQTFPDAALELAGYSFVDDPGQERWWHASGDECVVGPEHRLANESALLKQWARTGRARIWS